jgi:hypothetical protein
VLNRHSDHKNLEQAKHILKYICPREFRLHNVFIHATDRRETTHLFKDYTDREQEIKFANRGRDEKVYHRLSAVLPLISKMQKFQNRCAYDALIKYYCALWKNDDDANEFEEDGSKGSLGTDTDRSKLWTQKEISVLSTEQLPAETQAPTKDIDIIQHHISHHQVHLHAFSTHYRSLHSFVQL